MKEIYSTFILKKNLQYRLKKYIYYLQKMKLCFIVLVGLFFQAFINNFFPEVQTLSYRKNTNQSIKFL